MQRPSRSSVSSWSCSVLFGEPGDERCGGRDPERFGVDQHHLDRSDIESLAHDLLQSAGPGLDAEVEADTPGVGHPFEQHRVDVVDPGRRAPPEPTAADGVTELEDLALVDREHVVVELEVGVPVQGPQPFELADESFWRLEAEAALEEPGRGAERAPEQHRGRPRRAAGRVRARRSGNGRTAAEEGCRGRRPVAYRVSLGSRRVRRASSGPPHPRSGVRERGEHGREDLVRLVAHDQVELIESFEDDLVQHRRVGPAEEDREVGFGTLDQRGDIDREQEAAAEGREPDRVGTAGENRRRRPLVELGVERSRPERSSRLGS